MKKTLALLICAIMLVGVTGCSNEEYLTENEISTLIEEKVESLVEENKNLKKTIGELENKIVSLEEESTSNYNELKKLINEKASKSDLNTKIDELKKSLETKLDKTDYTELKSMIDTKANTADLNSKYGELKELINSNKTSIKQFESKYNELKDLVDKSLEEEVPTEDYTIDIDKLVELLGINESDKDKIEIIGNWIFIEDEDGNLIIWHYIFVDGKLYVTDNGAVYPEDSSESNEPEADEEDEEEEEETD